MVSGSGLTDGNYRCSYLSCIGYSWGAECVVPVGVCRGYGNHSDFGPIFGAIPAVLMAWTSGSLTTVFFVIALFIIIQQLENNLIYPLVVSKVVGISSILIILAAVVGGAIAGFIGVVIAVPLAGMVQEFFSDVRDGKLEKIGRSINVVL